MVKQAFAVAAARCLGNRVEPGQRTKHHWKVDIDAGLYQLGAHHPQRPRVSARAASGQALTDLSDDIGAVLAAHRRGQVQAFATGALVQRCDDLGRIVSGVDDDQHGIVLGNGIDQFSRGYRCLQIGRPLDFHPHQPGKQCGFVIDDAVRCGQATQALTRVEACHFCQGGLSGSTQQDGDAIVRHQQVQRVEDGLQKLRWQQLGFVEHDHAVGKPVQLAAARGARGKQRFEQLHVGSDYQRRVPVFASQAAAAGFVALQIVSLAVVLKHGVGPKDLPEHVGGLLDDAGIGNGINHSAMAMLGGMAQCKGQ